MTDIVLDGGALGVLGLTGQKNDISDQIFSRLVSRSQDGKTDYKSVTVASNATAEEFMDFYFDDHVRMKWVSNHLDSSSKGAKALSGSKNLSLLAPQCSRTHHCCLGVNSTLR